MKNLKKEYKLYIAVYILCYFIITTIIIFNRKLGIPNIKLSVNNIIQISNLVYAIIIVPILSIMSLIIFNIIPNNIKNFLVFLKYKNSLPSYRWKKLLVNEHRISSKKQIINQKKLSANAQHDIWYKYYQKHKLDIRILDSQKDYLFSRDLCVTTFILIIVNLLILLICFLFRLSTKYLIINSFVLIALYLIFMVVARNCANKFVCNVLVIELNN